MAERITRSSPQEVGSKEKQTGDESPAAMTSEDKTEGLEETGYASAPGSSEVMSGADSSIWTSDDPPPEDSRIQHESSATTLQSTTSEVASCGPDIVAKPTDLVKKPMSRKPKLRFFKKASPAAKRVSTPEVTENLIPLEEEKTRTSPRKTRSSSKFASGLPKLVSFRKTSTTDKSQPSSSAKQRKSSKSPSDKSPVRKLSSGIPTSVTSKKGIMVQLPDEEPGKETASKSARSRRGSASPSKAKSTKESALVQSKQTKVASQTGESEKSGDSSVRPKRGSKFTIGKFKTTKQDSADETPSTKRSSSFDAGSEATSSAFSLVRKGIKKMDVSGKLKKSASKKAESRLIEKEKKAARAKSTRLEEESSESERSLNEPRNFKKTTWKPLNPLQTGGFLEEDVMVCFSSSDKESTPTEMSTLSDSSGLVRGRPKSRHSRRRTWDSMSKVSSLDEEEVEVGGIMEGDARPQLQRQSNVPDLEMEEDCGDVFDSPEHKVTPKEKSGDESKG